MDPTHIHGSDYTGILNGEVLPLAFLDTNHLGFGDSNHPTTI